MYNFNIEKTVLRNLPNALKKQFWLDWLVMLLAPVKFIHNEFITTHTKIDYELSFSGSKIYLEHILNDEFDPNVRGIYIGNTGAIIQPYIYNIADNQSPNYIADYNQNQPFYIADISQYEEILFVVYVPVAVTFSEAKMKAIINRYRNTKPYTIQTY